MRQRDPDFGTPLSREDVARAIGIAVDEIPMEWPIQPVSTGLTFVFLFFDLREETIKIGQIRAIALNRGHILSNLLDRAVQFLLTTASNEDVRAFAHKTLRRGGPYPTIAAGNQCDFSCLVVSYFSVSLVHRNCS